MLYVVFQVLVFFFAPLLLPDNLRISCRKDARKADKPSKFGQTFSARTEREREGGKEKERQKGKIDIQGI